MNCRLLKRSHKLVRARYSKAAEDSRTPRRSRDCSHASRSARFWSAAVLCRSLALSLFLAISCRVAFAASSAPADGVGFRYAYDSISKQYAHPSGLVVLTPDGKISRYLFGVTFSPRELYTSLDTASSRKIGTRIQDLILLCFHYRPI